MQFVDDQAKAVDNKHISVFSFPVFTTDKSTLRQILRILLRKKTRLKKTHRMTVSILKQDPNTKRFKQMLIYFDNNKLAFV